MDRHANDGRQDARCPAHEQLARRGRDTVIGVIVAKALAFVRQAPSLVRDRIAHLDDDREPGPDLAAAMELVRSGALADLVRGDRAASADSATKSNRAAG